MPEYTVGAVVMVAVVAAVELFILRSGIFRSRYYWIALAIIYFFQAFVNGWLTRLSDPSVLYSPEMIVGSRFPFDSPVEDLLFGWAMVTLAIAGWVRWGPRREQMGVR
jgi:lycopene cyclase domain-containing protein